MAKKPFGKKPNSMKPKTGTVGFAEYLKKNLGKR